MATGKAAILRAIAPNAPGLRTLGKAGLKVFPLGFGGRGIPDAPAIARAADLASGVCGNGVRVVDTLRFLCSHRAEVRARLIRAQELLA